MEHKIGFIIPTKDREKDLRLILSSLAYQTRIPDQIIVVDGSEITSTVEKHALGAVYKCDDANSLAGAVSSLSLVGSDLLAGMGERARNLAFEFDREKVVDKIQFDVSIL